MSLNFLKDKNLIFPEKITTLFYFCRNQRPFHWSYHFQLLILCCHNPCTHRNCKGRIKPNSIQMIWTIYNNFCLTHNFIQNLLIDFNLKIYHKIFPKAISFQVFISFRDKWTCLSKHMNNLPLF